MSKSNFVKDYMYAIDEDRWREERIGLNREIGELVRGILDRLMESAHDGEKRKETKIFDNMKDSGCETANEVKIKYDVRGDMFFCDITSMCDKTGDEERAHALAAVIGAYANAVCDTPCFKIIAITPTVFMERFNKFFADLICEFGEEFVDYVTEKAG